MDSTVHGILQAWIPNPGIKPRSPTLQGDSLPAEPQGKPKNTGVGSLSFLQWVFPTQESNQGLLCCRRILYQLSYQGSLQCRRPEFNPWLGKMLWKKKWQPTPVFFPGEFHGKQSLAGCRPGGRGVRHEWAHTHTHTRTQMYKYYKYNILMCVIYQMM